MPVVKDYVEPGFPTQDCWDRYYLPLWNILHGIASVGGSISPSFATVFSAIQNPSVASNNPIEKAAALLHLMVDLEARCDAVQSAEPIHTDGWRWNELFKLCQSLGPEWNKLGDMAYNTANRLLNTGFTWAAPGAWASSVLQQSVTSMSGETF